MLQDYAKLTKGFYSCINERRIVRDNVGPLKTPTGQMVTTGNDMANTLSTYFSSVFTHEQLNNIPQLPRYLGNTLGTFIFRQEDVQKKLNHLNVYKSTVPDLIHPRVLLTLEDMLCGPLNHIFNKSAETGIILANGSLPMSLPFTKRETDWSLETTDKLVSHLLFPKQWRG